MVYFVLGMLAVVLLFILPGINATRRRSKKLLYIQEQWGKPDDAYRNPILIEQFAQVQQADSFHVLSQQTMTDIDFHALFTFLDRTTSKPGQQFLYYQLSHPTNHIPVLQQFDEQVNYFTANTALREQIQLQLAALDSHDAYFICSLLRDKVYSKPPWAFLLPIDTAIVIALLLGAIRFPVLLIWLLLPLGINMLLHLWNKNKAYQFVRSLPQLNSLIDVSRKLSQEDIPFDTTGIVSAIQRFTAFQRKFRLVGFNSFSGAFVDEAKQLGLFVIEIFKALFLVEVHAFFSCMKDVQENKAGIEALFRFTGSIDAAISTASVRNSMNYCRPVFTPEEKTLTLQNTYHPLVRDCVTNSLQVNNKSILITGSNMSGKTTFIRTVAINAITAQTIYTCFADVFIMPVLQVHSSIRIDDNVLNGTSYYLQEVNTIHTLIKQATEPHQNLFVLDEVFKGTNTIERVAAAKAVLHYLNKNNNIVLVSTHDIELSDLLENEYDLYHFEEQVQNNQLSFDHQLKTGRLITRNAIKLLEISGYPQEVIEEAQQAIK